MKQDPRVDHGDPQVIRLVTPIDPCNAVRSQNHANSGAYSICEMPFIVCTFIELRKSILMNLFFVTLL